MELGREGRDGALEGVGARRDGGRGEDFVDGGFGVGVHLGRGHGRVDEHAVLERDGVVGDVDREEWRVCVGIEHLGEDTRRWVE